MRKRGKKKMKINERKEANFAPLNKINFGEAFEYENNIFVKCLSDESSSETPNRIGMNVDTGRLCYFDSEDLVTPLDAEIVINK